MTEKSKIFYLSRFGIVSAILYCIPVIFFLKGRRFSDTWLLYLGSALFLVSVFVFGIMNDGKNADAKITYDGFFVTILGVIFSCILILILTFILTPDVFGTGSSADVLQQTPAAISKKGDDGILFMMLANAVIINFCAGVFAAIMTRSKNAENKLPANE
ncbi:MAG: hypothetical protein ABI472_07905 [Ginsengibacter sp.]